MDMEQIKTILEYVVGFLSGGVGATLLTVAIKSIVAAVSNYKSKKVSKLTESDKKQIAETVTENVLNAIHGGVKIDVDATINKATAGRIDKVESEANVILDRINILTQLVTAEGKVLAELKSPSAFSRDGLIEAIKGAPIQALEKIPQIEQPVLEVAEPIVHAVEEHKVKMSY